MCRNIKTLFNFEPPATEAEIRDAALQFVRKLSGFNAPSKANAAAFDHAVEEVSEAARRLFESLATTSAPRDREVEAAKAKARSAERFGKPVRLRLRRQTPLDEDQSSFHGGGSRPALKRIWGLSS